MKNLKILGFTLFLILPFSCVEESCKTCTSTTTYDGILQEEFTWSAEYCGDELEGIELSAPSTTYSNGYTIVTAITCN